MDEAEKMKDEIDVLIICGGSATDLPVQTPKYAQWFNVVDSFDTHARIPEHFENVDKAAKESGHVGIISVEMCIRDSSYPYCSNNGCSVVSGTCSGVSKGSSVHDSVSGDRI